MRKIIKFNSWRASIKGRNICGVFAFIGLLFLLTGIDRGLSAGGRELANASYIILSISTFGFIFFLLQEVEFVLEADNFCLINYVFGKPRNKLIVPYSDIVKVNQGDFVSRIKIVLVPVPVRV